MACQQVHIYTATIHPLLNNIQYSSSSLLQTDIDYKQVYHNDNMNIDVILHIKYATWNVHTENPDFSQDTPGMTLTQLFIKSTIMVAVRWQS